MSVANPDRTQAEICVHCGGNTAVNPDSHIARCMECPDDHGECVHGTEDSTNIVSTVPVNVLERGSAETPIYTLTGLTHDDIERLDMALYLLANDTALPGTDEWRVIAALRDKLSW